MLSEFFRDKPLNHLVMLAAIVVQFVSYFFLYGDGSDGSASLGVGPDFNWTQTWSGLGGPAYGTGWETNPQGWIILVILAFAFLRADVYDHPLMQKFGWWLGVVLIVLCSLSSDGIRAPGSSLGMVAMGLALLAAILHQFAGRKIARP